MNGEGASVQQGDGNEVIPPGEDDRNYRRENDRMKDHRDRDRNYDRDRDRERKRRSRYTIHRYLNNFDDVIVLF